MNSTRPSIARTMRSGVACAHTHDCKISARAPRNVRPLRNYSIEMVVGSEYVCASCRPDGSLKAIRLIKGQLHAVSVGVLGILRSLKGLRAQSVSSDLLPSCPFLFPSRLASHLGLARFGLGAWQGSSRRKRPCDHYHQHDHHHHSRGVFNSSVSPNTLCRRAYRHRGSPIRRLQTFRKSS